MAIEPKDSSVLETAIEAGEQGRIREWTLAYLLSEGDNRSLAKGITYHASYFLGPQDISLNRLQKIAGPELGMPYSTESEDWEEAVKRYASLIQKGWHPPPLIVIDFIGPGLSIADGNKRHEALSRSGYVTYPSIFCLRSDPRVYNLGR